MSKDTMPQPQRSHRIDGDTDWGRGFQAAMAVYDGALTRVHRVYGIAMVATSALSSAITSAIWYFNS